MTLLVKYNIIINENNRFFYTKILKIYRNIANMKKKIMMRGDKSEIVAYNSGDVAVYVRRGKLSEYDFAADAHWHDDIELIAVLSGQMDYNINGEIVRLRAGEGIFVNARRLHYGFSDTQAECDFICALLHPLPFCRGSEDVQNHILSILQDGAPPWMLFRRDAEGAALFDAVCELHLGEREKYFSLLALSAGYRIWAQLLSLLPQNKKPDDRFADLPALKCMLCFIQEHFGEKLTLGEIAAAGAMCKSSCTALFKKYLHTTPVQYLIDYRLKKAAELLHTDKKIIEIGLDVGFAGVSYFIETFRKKYGRSPAEYRKSLQTPPEKQP